jgi:hypothetical protein
MNTFERIFQRVISDDRYQKNLDWGEPRSGHPEGSVRAHIAELEQNLDLMRQRLSDDEYWKLKLLIHTHDTFKADANRVAPITHPRSHASLARTFLSEYCDDPDLLNMVQFHDEPYALWRQNEKGNLDQQRFSSLLSTISDWNLFIAFNIIDDCTVGKSRQPLQWFLQQLAGKTESQFTASDIL